MSNEGKGGMRQRGGKKEDIVAAEEEKDSQGKEAELTEFSAAFWFAFGGLSVLGGAILTFLVLWFLGDTSPGELYEQLRLFVTPQDPPHPIYKIGPNQWLAEQRAKGEILFTRETLAPFNASKAFPKRSIVLCVLGSCFDVTTGRQYYEEGNEYNCFAGNDGSRSYVTGDFSKGACIDYVLDLNMEQLLGVESWRKFYFDHAVYEHIGKLVGKYYDSTGKPTAELLEVEKKCADEKAAEKERKRLPDCNIKFRPEAGAEVWCSTSSGGVKRDWVGVPRMIYAIDNKRKCVCVTEEEAVSNAHAFRAYRNCTQDPEKGTICYQVKAKISAKD